MSVENIPVLKGPELLTGTRTVIGAMTAKKLLKFASIPTFRYKHGGYQRDLQQSRVSSLAKALISDRVDLPTAILLSLRDVDYKDVVKHVAKQGTVLRLKTTLADTTHSLQIVDGQHRVRALEQAIQKNPELGKTQIPFVCMIGANETEEMNEFYVVNTNSKSVPTDLALELMKARVAGDSDAQQELQDRRQYWKVQALEIVELLAANSEFWKGRIRFAGEPKDKTLITASALVNTFKRLFEQSFLFQGYKSTSERYEVVAAYWDAIMRTYPDANRSPSEYNIQSGLGAHAMHGIMPHILDLARYSSNSKMKDKASLYKTHLNHPLTEIHGRNQANEVVEGQAFWRKGKEGAAAGYSGAAGRDRLTSDLRSLLPSTAD